uniref:Uncharacterized protein n=1 Tax=Leersia perrieri TaxID=77586 RepID=A0A0D9WEX0_9ORYZ
MAAAATSPATSVAAATFSPSPQSLFQHQTPRGHRTSTSVVAFARPRRFRGVNPSTSSDDRPSRVARQQQQQSTSTARDDGFGALEAELWRLQRTAELRLHRLAAEADEAYRDLRSAARDVGGDRVVLTLRRSSLRFAAAALLWSLALSAATWVALGWAFRAWSRRGLGLGGGDGAPVVRRRDRSLGGKEVVVAVSTPSPVAMAPASRVAKPAKVRRREPKARVPEWWPELGEEAVDQGPGMERFATLANRLVRGVKVSFDTENARDSFYRAAINFVLDNCSRAVQENGATQINGENPRIFLAGLASNIGLDKFRATTLVCASVAARTRALFLQCWALEMQGKRSEALDELSKIYRIHNMFPPEENSAEMEMVAGGLKKNLQVEERVHLLSLYRGICTTGNIRTAAEALGLSLPDQ